MTTISEMMPDYENNSIGGNAHIDLDNYIDDKQIMLALLYSCDLGCVEEMGGFLTRSLGDKAGDTADYSIHPPMRVILMKRIITTIVVTMITLCNHQLLTVCE